jgi:hypothetical protein
MLGQRWECEIPGVYFGLGRDPNGLLLAKFRSGTEEATPMETDTQSTKKDGRIQAKDVVFRVPE